MSAFLVDRIHIDVLIRLGLRAGYHCRLRWGTGEELRPDNASEIGRMLARENVASVRARYPGPGGASMAWWDPEGYEYRIFGPCPDPVAGLKAIACYEYQSCEHDGWRESAARRFCEALRRALIAALPGYDEAPWDWDDDTARNGVPCSPAPKVQP